MRSKRTIQTSTLVGRHMQRTGRRVVAASAIITALSAGAVAALSACGNGQPSPSDVLRSDGFGNVQQLSEAEVIARSGDSQGSAYITSAAYGTRGPDAEMALQLTPAGVALVRGHIPQLESIMGGDGNFTGVQLEGSILVFDGPVTSVHP